MKLMSNTNSSDTNPGQPAVYEIRIKGHLGPQWSDWFEGMITTPQDNGDTVVTGLVIDQAALHGLLRKVRDLGVPLLAITEVQPDQQDPQKTE
jgi:hypothetical protein